MLLWQVLKVIPEVLERESHASLRLSEQQLVVEMQSCYKEKN